MKIKHEGKLYWFIHELPSYLKKERLDTMNMFGILFGLLTALLFLTTNWTTVTSICAILTLSLPALSLVLEIVAEKSNKYIMRNRPYYMQKG